MAMTSMAQRPIGRCHLQPNAPQNSARRVHPYRRKATSGPLPRLPQRIAVVAQARAWVPSRLAHEFCPPPEARVALWSSEAASTHHRLQQRRAGRAPLWPPPTPWPATSAPPVPMPWWRGRSAPRPASTLCRKGHHTRRSCRSPSQLLLHLVAWTWRAAPPRHRPLQPPQEPQQAWRAPPVWLLQLSGPDGPRAAARQTRWLQSGGAERPRPN